MTVDIKHLAIQTIKTEAAAIEKLASFIDDDFERCVTMLFNAKGRLIVTGIGKAQLLPIKLLQR